MEISKVMARGVTAAIVAAALAVPGSVQAAVKYLHMDAFKATFQPLPGGGYGRYYPSAHGVKTPTSPPLNSYGSCAVLRLPVASLVREITYVVQGDGGFSYAFLQEYRYGEINHLKDDYVSYPTSGERTLHPVTDPAVPIRKGYRYYICVEGQPGPSAGDFNQVMGFRIRYRRP